MIKIQLNQDQREALKALRNTRSFLGERAHYILLSDEGCAVKDIAQRLNRHEHTVRTWIKAFVARGIEGLQNKHPPGRPKIKGPVVEQEINIILVNTPREFGYQEEGWTVSILLDYFSKKQLDVKEDTVRRALKKSDFISSLLILQNIIRSNGFGDG